MNIRMHSTFRYLQIEKDSPGNPITRFYQIKYLAPAEIQPVVLSIPIGAYEYHN